ncbi:hypothetical protein O4H49_20075 [Kiloniella laminariae]|uniref:Uncharacterized protein n=1 Tax=Kiloniella laminariae TaxID=454162 RepID=A0ABT4LPN9_9PROT|nr:hypothetical protein [Kiloniella laminariae]MCZ4283093.1 hypothetical protein [Kiloniella laminariae]
MENKADDIRVFSVVQTTWGVPSNIFWGSVALAFLLGFVMTPSMGVIFGMVFGITLCVILVVILIAVHKGDPQGLEAWVRRIKNPGNTWRGGNYKKKRFVVIK